MIVNQNEIYDSRMEQTMEYKIIDMFKNNEVYFKRYTKSENETRKKEQLERHK